MWVLFIARNVSRTIVQAYASPDIADSSDKDDFYRDLGGVLRDVPGRDFLIVLGDFNARVGNDTKRWKGVVGRQGVAEEPSDNGKRLLSICATYDCHLCASLGPVSNTRIYIKVYLVPEGHWF